MVETKCTNCPEASLPAWWNMDVFHTSEQHLSGKALASCMGLHLHLLPFVTQNTHMGNYTHTRAEDNSNNSNVCKR